MAKRAKAERRLRRNPRLNRAEVSNNNNNNINSNNKSYDDSVKLKRTEMDPFRLG